MPWRSRAIASTRSSRSAVSVSCWVSISRSSSSARRLTAPSRSRSRRSRSSSVSTSATSGSGVARLDLGEVRDRVGLDLEHLADLMGDVGQPCAWRLRRAPRRGRALRARAPSASSAARTARSHAPSAFSASARRSAAALRRRFRGLRPRRSAARRFSSKIAARRPAKRAPAWPRRCACRASRSGRWRARWRSLQALPVGADGVEPPVGELGLARQRLRFGAHLGELRALAFDLGAHVGELALPGRPTAAARPSALSAIVQAGAAPRRGRRSAGSWPR